jgi:hypothetical protein
MNWILSLFRSRPVLVLCAPITTKQLVEQMIKEVRIRHTRRLAA